jgi:hypothetical protein
LSDEDFIGLGYGALGQALHEKRKDLFEDIVGEADAVDKVDKVT